jgi:branched-chain amino acid transport system substrate-binding protein
VGALALAAAVSLTAAACGSSGGSSSDNGGKPTFTIGFQGPLSGDNAQLGINGLDGFKVAIDDANKSGTLPFTLKYVTQDDQGDPGVAPTAAQALVNNKDVIALVGPMFSGATKASEKYFTDAHLVSVSPSATNPDLTTKYGFRTFYRVIPNDTVQGQGVGAYIAKVLKPKKVYSVDDASEYGTGLAKVLESTLKTDNVPYVHDSVNATKDYTSEATKIMSANPDLIYYSGYYSTFSLFTKALRDAGYKGKLMSGDGSLDPKYISQAGTADAEGAIISCPCLWAQADPNAATFVSEYKALNHSDPGTYSAESYDAANAIINVLKQLGTSATRESVAAAFGKVDFPGLTKEIKFTPTGEVSVDLVDIYEVKNGAISLLGPVSKLTAG